MKKITGLFFGLLMAVAMLPAVTFGAQAANVELSGTYTEATITKGEYILTGDVSLSGGVTISEEVTIDLNGKTLSGKKVPYFTVAKGGKLTILDSGDKKDGKIDGSTVTEENATTSLLVVGGTFMQRGGNITGYTMYSTETNRRGTAVYVDDGGIFEMYDGARITNNKLGSSCTGRGTVGVRKAAVFTMYGGEISGNTSQYGGAVSNSGDGFTVNIHGGKITGNTATGGGSAMYLGKGTITITGGEISGNCTAGTSDSYAYTLFTDGIDFTMTGGTIGSEASGSRATKSIRFADGKVRISGESQILLPMSVSACRDIRIGGLTGAASVAASSRIALRWDETAKETKNAEGNYVYAPQALSYKQGWTQLTEELAASGTLISGTYYLKEDVTLPNSVSVSGNVTLYLDGHVLTGREAPLFVVEEQAAMTINDRFGWFGSIKGIKESDNAQREMLLVNGKLVLEEGVLAGHVNTGTGTRDAGAVKLATRGEFIMNGGAITGNTTKGRGGAILVPNDADFTMTGGEISGNKAAIGPGVYVIGSYNGTNDFYDYGRVTLTGGVIQNNGSNQDGAEIYAQIADLRMSSTGQSEGVKIIGHSSGNTVYCNGCKVTMRAGFIDAERASTAGTSSLLITNTTAGAYTRAEFTGTAVVGGAGLKQNKDLSVASIHDLRRTGKVVSHIELTVDPEDVTVGKTTKDSVHTYSYARPVDLRILSIGNSYSMDALNTLAHVGDVFGLNIDAAYLYEGSCTLRRHAYGLANSGFKPCSSKSKNVPEGALYEFYRTDPATGDIAHQGIYVNIPYALEQAEWDIVTLHQGTTTVGFPGTYNSDIDFLSDYIKTAEPNADLYWYMTWSYDPDISPDSSRGPTFAEHFDRDSRGMYNSIVDVINAKIATGGAYEDVFEGWFPVGTAVQNMRELGYDHSMNRDGFHLSYKGGRFLASLTILKTLYPELDLTQLKPEDLAFVEMRSATAIADEFNVDDDLDMVVQAVNAAVAEARTGNLDKLTLTTQQTKVETVTDGASVTLAQTGVPFKPQFPSAVSLADGTVVVAAYENAAVKPNVDNTVNTYSGYCFEGYGRIVVWDDSYTQPLLVIDQPQLEAWGISSTAGRYETLLANKSAQYTIFSDPRDPQLTAVTVDADGDGQVDDEMLTLTFWVRDYKNTGTSERGSFLVCSVDGGESWQYAGKTQDSCLVCGDAAVFADGSLLLPCMDGTQLCAVYMTWNADSQCWVEQDHQTVTVPDTSDVDGAYTVDGFALAAPEGDTVYALVGGNGVVLQSLDRGESWTAVGNQAGQIGQPGLVVVDADRLFATWTSTVEPYDTFGKLYVIGEGWDNSAAPMLYDAVGTAAGKKEAGSPAPVLLDNGDVLVVSYDCNYRSVVGTAVEMAQDEPMNVQDYKVGDTISAPTKKGYTFAGWYADADHNVVYEAVTGSAYAKFVNKRVLSVKVQIAADTTADSGKTDLRMVTTVDSLNYHQVGFRVTVGGVPSNIPIVSSTVFKRIVANDGGVAYDQTPDVFGAQSRYFMTYTIKNVPQAAFGAEIVVTPYWVTLDGTEVDGEALSFTIRDVIKANSPVSGGLTSSESGTGDSESFESMFGGSN